MAEKLKTVHISWSRTATIKCFELCVVTYGGKPIWQRSVSPLKVKVTWNLLQILDRVSCVSCSPPLSLSAPSSSSLPLLTSVGCCQPSLSIASASSHETFIP